MLPSVPGNPCFHLHPAPQLPCFQYFACNHFIFIDLAGTRPSQPNQFIDLRENAIFFRSSSCPYRYPNATLCTHIKAAGQRCGSPALRGEFFCYFHTRIIKGVQQRVDMRLHSMALLEDCESIQLSLMHVVDGLVKGTLDPNRAKLIIQALRIAARNAKNVRFDDCLYKPTDPPMVREVPDYARQYEIEHPELGQSKCGAGAPAREPAITAPCSADTPVREAKPTTSTEREPLAPPEAAQQNVSMESAKSAPAEPAAKRRKNAAHSASCGAKAENDPAPKERKNTEQELQELKRVQAAIEGAQRGKWHDLRTVFEFAGITEPSKEAPY